MADKQVIVSISREFGSGGHDIAEKISKDLGYKFYDKDIINEVAKDFNADPEEIKKYDEHSHSRMLSRRVGNYTNSMSDILLEKQFEFIKKKAEEGESFVVIGRCADCLLRGNKGLITIFITGNKDYKTARIMKQFSLNEKDAADKMKKVDMERRTFHNRYSDHKWGDSRYYDLIINGSYLGVEKTADLLEEYIKSRAEAML